MIFAWDDINVYHIAKHAVSSAEVQEVVAGAQPPFPQEIGNGKLVVRGQSSHGRYLQVIFVLKSPHEVPYESLTMEDWLEIETGNVPEVIRVIHAMELTPAMKRNLRKRRN